MKSFISKLRNKKLKGNVSLLIILILLASSVIALLSINQIQRLLTYWNMTFNYFRAFYIAKAGTELWLTEVYYREAWFQQTINSGDAVITENLVWVYSGFNPYFTMDIEWQFKYLTDDVRYTDKCDDDNKITLGTWEWIMLSLFTDETKWFDNILSEKSIIKALDDITNLKMSPKWEWLMFWLFSYYKNGYDMNSIVVKEWNDLNKFLSDNMSKVKWDRRYLTIKNSWNETVSFCISWKWDIPYSDSLITVHWNYWDMEVWLQSVVNKEIPFWAINVLTL